MVQLNRTYYSLLNSHGQNFFKFGFYRAKFKQNPLNLPIYSACLETCPGRELSEIPVDHANSAQFAHTVRESREIHTICSHYTLPFRCLTSGRERHEITANQVKSAQFAPIFRELRKFCTLRTKIHAYVINFQISDHRQRNQENWSESSRFRSIRPLITQIT